MSVVLKAEKREQLGSSATKKIKREGRLPAVIYSKNGNINLSLIGEEFEHEYFKGNALTSMVELELDGKKINVIAHKIELDPVSDRPVHVDFLNLAETKIVRAKPKLVFTNSDKSPGIKKGGFLHVVMRKVEIVCEAGKTIPNKIEVNIGSLQVTQKVRAKDLKLPEGVSLYRKDNFLIASIIGRGKAEEDPAAAAGAAAAPAAGSAAPKAEEKKAPEKKK